MKNLLFIFLLIPLIGFSQGKLDQAKENLSSRSSSSSSSSSSHLSEGESEDNSSFKNSMGQFFGELLVFITYKAAFGNFEPRHFSPYPYYYDNVQGAYDFGLEKGDKNSLLGVGVNYLAGNSINSAEANINYRFHPFVGVDLSHQHFFEEGRTGSDHLNITSLMANYYRLRERLYTVWWGIGMTYVGNEVNTYGIAYNIGLEFYPVKPISFHLSYKQSFINESHINVTKYQTKYHRRKMAFYIGYHDISIAEVKASGLVFGVEASF